MRAPADGAPSRRGLPSLTGDMPGDISAKLVGYGGWWLVALATLIVAYAVGTSVLQWAHQRATR